jgi:hypothetical protein
MSKTINQTLNHTLRRKQVVIQSQNQALEMAQQKINDLQTAQKKVEDDRILLLKELEAIKVMTP